MRRGTADGSSGNSALNRRSARREHHRRSAARASCRPSSRPCRAAPRSRFAGQKQASEHEPSAPPRISKRRQHAAGRAGASATSQIAAFDQQERSDGASRHVAREQIADDVVADASARGSIRPPSADDEAADRRPPHPVHRQAFEQVLGRRAAAVSRPECRPATIPRPTHRPTGPTTAASGCAAKGNSGAGAEQQRAPDAATSAARSPG